VVTAGTGRGIQPSFGLSMSDEARQEVDEFVLREMDSVPHLEALLLLWTNRPKRWSAEEMASALYVQESEARRILQGLARRNLAERGAGDGYGYWGSAGERDGVVEALDGMYRKDLVRISRMIHAKASPGVRDFADAFRFTKGKE
jgi:hypothetical protein